MTGTPPAPPAGGTLLVVEAGGAAALAKDPAARPAPARPALAFAAALEGSA